MEQDLFNGHNGADLLETVENDFVNGETDNIEENGEPKSISGNGVDIRIKKKAKRLVKHFNNDDLSCSYGESSFSIPPRSWKNNRRPRNGYGRGLPKKGKSK